MTTILQKQHLFFLFFVTQALHGLNFEHWLVQQEGAAIVDLFNNIEPPATALGSVIASPSRENPDYYYDWVRDGAIAMMEVIKLYKDEDDSTIKQKYLDLILRYAQNARDRQKTSNRTGDADGAGLGEPKWNVDNSRFDADWGRPQHDGPAFRAYALAYFAKVLINERKGKIVETLYNPHSPGVLNIDLEFILQNWDKPSYEMWEEVCGLNLSTLLVHERALRSLAELAYMLEDKKAPEYMEQAEKIAEKVDEYWDEERGYFIQTREQYCGLSDKHNNLDAAVILAMLLNKNKNNFLLANNDRVLKTAEMLRAKMHDLYFINKAHSVDADEQRMGDAIGRYPEDHYNGISTDGLGNPWFLITAAFAELNYAAAQHYIIDEYIEVTANNLAFLQFTVGDKTTLTKGEVIDNSDTRFLVIMHSLLQQGDGYLRRWRFHADREDPSTAEQFNRDTGFMQGAAKLTWNCAAFLSAMRQREKLKRDLNITIEPVEGGVI